MTNPLNPRPRYRRIVLKLSGEARPGLRVGDPDQATVIAHKIKSVTDLGVRSRWSSARATCGAAAKVCSAVCRRPPPTTWA